MTQKSYVIQRVMMTTIYNSERLRHTTTSGTEIRGDFFIAVVK